MMKSTDSRVTTEYQLLVAERDRRQLVDAFKIALDVVYRYGRIQDYLLTAKLTQLNRPGSSPLSSMTS